LESYTFHVTIHSIQLCLSLGVQLYFTLKRGSRKTETTTPVRLVPRVLQTAVEQTLQLKETLQIKRNEALPKKAHLHVRAEVIGQGSRRVGSTTLNLAEYINKPAQEIQYKVESNLDRNCFVRLSIISTRLDELLITENLSEVSGGSFLSESFEFSKANLDQDLAELEDKKPVRPLTVVINKPKTSNRRDEDEPLHVFDLLQEQIKDLRAQVAVYQKDLKHLTKERNQLQLSVSMSEVALSTEKESNAQLVGVLEEQLRLSTTQYQDRLRQTEAELEDVHRSNQGILGELEASQRQVAELKLEVSDLELKVDKFRQQTCQCASLQKELEMRSAKVLRLSRELDKVLTENSKLIQGVLAVKALLQDVPDSEVDSRLVEIKGQLSQLDCNIEQRRFADTATGRSGESVSSGLLISLKSQLEEASKKLKETARVLETERIDRANSERRLLAKLEEYEKRVSRLSVESSQMKERQSVMESLEHRLGLNRASVITSEMSAKLDKRKSTITHYKQERAQMKRTLTSLEADNQELRKALTEARTRLVEAVTRNSDEESKLTLLQLTSQLDNQAYCFSVEKAQLLDRIFQLELELEVLERQKNAQIYELEQELAHQHLLHKQIELSSVTHGSSTDQKWQTMLAELRDTNAEITDQLTQMESERLKIEQMLMDSRTALKQKEEEYSDLLGKFRKGQDQIYDLRSHNMTLEKEVAKLSLGLKP
jgi:chromosome segregation ATPase